MWTKSNSVNAALQLVIVCCYPLLQQYIYIYVYALCYHSLDMFYILLKHIYIVLRLRLLRRLLQVPLPHRRELRLLPLVRHRSGSGTLYPLDPSKSKLKSSPEPYTLTCLHNPCLRVAGDGIVAACVLRQGPNGNCAAAVR